MDLENAATACNNCHCESKKDEDTSDKINPNETANSTSTKEPNTSAYQFLSQKYLDLPYHIRCSILQYLTHKELIELLACFESNSELRTSLLLKSSGVWGKISIKISQYDSVSDVFNYLTVLQRNLTVTCQEVHLDFSECHTQHVRNYFYEFDKTQGKTALNKPETGDAIDFLRNTVTSIDFSLMNLSDTYCEQNAPIMYRIMSKLPKITSLRLSDCDWLSEAEVRMIRLFPDLKTLDASSNTGLTDIFIDHLSSSFGVERSLQIKPLNLTSLNLLDIPNIAGSGIATVCREFINIEHLYLDGENLAAFNGIGLGKLEYLKTLHIMYISEHLDDVEFLKNTMESGIKQDFTNLKLTQKKFDTKMLNQFLQTKLSNEASIIELTDAGVENSTVEIILEKSKELKVLHLNWNRKLNDEIFYKFASRNENHFKNLKRLSLVGCNEALATHGEYPWFTESMVRQEFPSLRFVSFAGCDFVNDKALKCIVKSFGKSITIRDYYDEAIDCCGKNCCFET